MTYDGSHISTGSQGEDLACAYLVEKGYTILERNVRRKWGEIDIICTVPRRTSEQQPQNSVPRGTIWSLIRSIVPRGTIARSEGGGKLVFIEVKTMRSRLIRPEENMTLAKQKKLIRTCLLYLTERGYTLDCEWQIDVVAIVLDNDSGAHSIEHIEQAVHE